jgi:zinc transport system substrate-binding protein
VRLRTVLILAIVLASGSAACGGRSSATEDNRLSVVTSFYPLEFAAQRLGGRCVAVTDLTPPGVEPHDLELAPDDITTVATADVVFYLGGGFQPSLEEAIQEAHGRVVDLLRVVPTQPVPSGGETGLSVDPHVWLDPARFRTIVQRIGRVLEEAAPGCDGLAARTGELTRRLDALDEAFRGGLARCAFDTIVTNHAAFGYLAEAYGLHQAAIAGVEPETEPSARRLAQLRDLVQRLGITTVFTEELVSPKVADTLASEAGVRTQVLFTIEGLTDEEAAAEKDYLTLMEANLDALHGALGCD